MKEAPAMADGRAELQTEPPEEPAPKDRFVLSCTVREVGGGSIIQFQGTKPGVWDAYMREKIVPGVGGSVRYKNAIRRAVTNIVKEYLDEVAID